MAGWRKLGLIAGAGDLPVVLAQNLAATQRPFFVARIAPVADAALDRYEGAAHGPGRMGDRIDAMRAAGCDAVVFAGIVARANLATLDMDDVAQQMAPALIAAMRKGDDAVLRLLVAEHEHFGFRVVGADEVMPELMAAAGVWGAVQPNADHTADIAKAAKVAAAIGHFDIGQGAVVCDGLVLAVEAQEGTDKMLKRVADLPAAVRGSTGARRGVLVKRPKPIQDPRVDLPTIGVLTIENAAAAGLAGVAVQVGGALVVDRAEVVAAANRASVFVCGFDSAEVDKS